MTRKNVVVTLALLVLVGAIIVPYSLAQDRGRDRDRRPPGPGPIEQMEQMGRMMKLLEMMKEVCFDEGAAAMVAIGDLKDAVRRKPKEIIEDLEAQLKKTKTLGLRNAIRLTLKDLYKVQGADEKVLDHLRTMLAENDAALQDFEEE
ncbi:unnamed protein product, partial [marine sediment metagenome]